VLIFLINKHNVRERYIYSFWFLLWLNIIILIDVAFSIIFNVQFVVT